MKNRLFALVLVVVMMLSATAMAEINATGMPITTEPIVLTAMCSQSPIQGDFNEMVILKQFAEASNVNIKFECIPSSDRATQLSLRLASGELPDILFKMSVGISDQAKYCVDEGMFVALSDYAELTPNLNKYFEEYPTAKQAVTLGVLLFLLLLLFLHFLQLHYILMALHFLFLYIHHLFLRLLFLALVFFQLLFHHNLFHYFFLLYIN